MPVDAESRERAAPVSIRRRHRAGAHPAACSVPPAEAGACVVRRPQALVVDDCRAIARRVAHALESRGFRATVAKDGFAGLVLAREQRFDLVVVDVDMPFVDGLTMLRQLRAEPGYVDTPVVVLSAKNHSSDHSRALALGASGAMSKPLQIGPLTQLVDSIMPPHGRP